MPKKEKSVAEELNEMKATYKDTKSSSGNDNKKPFVVTTKSEEDLINKSSQNANIYLIGGIIAIIIGIIMLFSK